MINDLYGSTEQIGREEYPYSTVDRKGEKNMSKYENCSEMQDTNHHTKESKPITEVDVLPNDSTYNTLLRSAHPSLLMPTSDQYSQLKAVSQGATNKTSQEKDCCEIYSVVDN